MAAILKPILRAFKYTWLYRTSQWRVLQTSSYSELVTSPPITFVVGCGRSGTTILGKVLAQHPQISYRFEPYHLWAALDYRTDVLNLFHRGNAHLIMDKTFATAKTQQIFARLFWPQTGQMLIEKTPLNVFRIGYLRAIAPQAKFIHIVRDGVDVAHSIGKLATSNPYKIAGKPQLNQWWGVAGSKWDALEREGSKVNYFSSEVKLLQTEQQRGAYEWLTSMAQMDSWRSDLGGSLHEIVYDNLIHSPQATLRQLCVFLGLDAPSNWLEIATKLIQKQNYRFKSVDLPETMARVFNQYQQKYQFPQRAISINLAVNL